MNAAPPGLARPLTECLILLPMGPSHGDPARVAAGIRQTVGRLVLDLDLMLDGGQAPDVRRDMLVHLIIELAGHLCRTEGFRETALLYAVVAEAAHAQRRLSPDDIPQILRSWHDRLRSEGRPASPPSPLSLLPPSSDSAPPAARSQPDTAKPHKPKVGPFGRELARHQR
jgi:hypothetical protein